MFRRAFISVLLFSLIILGHPYPTQAGGPINFDRTQVEAPSYEAYLNCSCQDGFYTVTFFNQDTIPLSLVGKGWQVGPLEPQTSATYTFFDPATYSYIVKDYPASKGSVTILNQAPSFPDGGQLIATSIDYTSLTLAWPKLKDDGQTAEYRLFKDGNLVTVTADTSYKLSSLKDNTRYTFILEGYDSAGLTTSQKLTLAVTTLKKTASAATPTPTLTPTPAISPSQTSTPRPSASLSPDHSPSQFTDTRLAVEAEVPLQVDRRTIEINGLVRTPSKLFLVDEPFLIVTGLTAPHAYATLTLHPSEIRIVTQADEQGNWKATLSLDNLKQGQHTLTVRFSQDNLTGPEVTVATFNFRQNSLFFLFTLLLTLCGSSIAFWQLKKHRTNPHT